MQQIPATVSHYQFTAVCCLRTMYDVHLCLIKKPVVNFIVMLIELFTALHAMQTRSSDENYVGPSVCQTCALWQNRRKICPDFYTIRKII